MRTAGERTYREDHRFLLFDLYFGWLTCVGLESPLFLRVEWEFSALSECQGNRGTGSAFRTQWWDGLTDL